VEVSNDDPPPVVLPEDFLPDPQADAITKWWANNNGRFHAGARYLFGQVRSPDVLRTALTRGATWRQEVVLLELVNTKIGAPQVEPGAWAREQLKQLT
jgi:hypothetical protein